VLLTVGADQQRWKVEDVLVMIVKSKRWVETLDWGLDGRTDGVKHFDERVESRVPHDRRSSSPFTFCLFIHRTYMSAKQEGSASPAPAPAPPPIVATASPAPTPAPATPQPAPPTPAQYSQWSSRTRLPLLC